MLDTYSFLRRLFLFSIGLIIGLFILNRFVTNKNAKFDYLPNARTLKSIRNKPVIYFSQEAKAVLKQKAIDTTKAMQLLSYGKVDFKNINRHQKPCQNYLIKPTYKTPNISLTVKRCDSISVIVSVQ